MTGDEHVLVVRDGEAYAADDPALALDVDTPVEQDEATVPASAPQEDAPPRPAEPVAGEVVVYEPPLDPARMSLGDIGKVGRVFAASGMFPDTTEAARAIVKIMAGQEVGIGPFAAMANIDIIKGNPTMNARLQRALVQAHPRYAYRVLSWTDEACEMEWYEDGEIVGQSSFSLDDAKRAGLSGTNWQKYPKAMLLARATSQGAGAYAPGIFAGGFYSEGEIE